MLNPSTRSRSRAWVEVRLDRLRENLLAVRREIGPGPGIVPMVKAEAYGLGMRAVVAALRDFPTPADPWAFGVATAAEGEHLREIGWAGRAIVFSPAPPGDYDRAAAADLTLALSDLEAVSRFAEAARKIRRQLAFHVEIDTGIGRAGFPWHQAAQWGAEVLARAGGELRWEGTFTHFHSADEGPPEPTELQWNRFRQATAELPPLEPPPLLHVANSAGIFRWSGFGCNLARPGIYLYGGGAGPGVVPAPVVSVRARVTRLQAVEPGATVGYGATHVARKPERWGTLGIGYGDGIRRALSAGGGEAIVRGRRVPIIGRVSMDMLTVDLTDVPEARVGEIATLIGAAGGQRIELDEVAARCGTISYEVLTGLGTRLPRLYLNEEPETDAPDD